MAASSRPAGVGCRRSERPLSALSVGARRDAAPATNFRYGAEPVMWQRGVLNTRISRQPGREQPEPDLRRFEAAVRCVYNIKKPLHEVREADLRKIGSMFALMQLEQLVLGLAIHFLSKRAFSFRHAFHTFGGLEHQAAEHVVWFVTLSKVYPLADDLDFTVCVFAIIAIDPIR